MSPAVSGGRNLAAGATLLHARILLAHLLDAAATGTGDVGGVAEVGVDADQLRDAPGLDILDDDIARSAVVGAVATAAVELAGRDDGEVADGDGAAAVVLDNLVVSVLGASTFDEDIARAQCGNGIYQSRL